MTNLFNGRLVTRKEALAAMAVGTMGVTGNLCFGQARAGQGSRSISVDQLEPGIQQELLKGTYAKAIARVYEVTLDYECDFSDSLAKKGISQAVVAMPKVLRMPGQFPITQDSVSLLPDRSSASSSGERMREVVSENGLLTVLVGKVTTQNPVARCHIRLITCQMAASPGSINNVASPDVLSPAARAAYLEPNIGLSPGTNIEQSPELSVLITRLGLTIRSGEGSTEFAYRVAETLMKDGFKYGSNTKPSLALTIAEKGGICGPLAYLNTAILRYNKIPASTNSLLVNFGKCLDFSDPTSDIHVQTQFYDEKRHVFVHSDLAQIFSYGLQNISTTFGRSCHVDAAHNSWVPIVFMRVGGPSFFKLEGSESKPTFIGPDSSMLCIGADGRLINTDRRPDLQIKSRSIVSINGVGFAGKGK